YCDHGCGSSALESCVNRIGSKSSSKILQQSPKGIVPLRFRLVGCKRTAPSSRRNLDIYSYNLLFVLHIKTSRLHLADLSRTRARDRRRNRNALRQRRERSKVCSDNCAAAHGNRLCYSLFCAKGVWSRSHRTGHTVPYTVGDGGGYGNRIAPAKRMARRSSVRRVQLRVRRRRCRVSIHRDRE